MQHIKIFKFTSILILIGMIIALIINYYFNSWETEDIINNNINKTNTSKSNFESIIIAPKYYSYNKKNQKLFIQAEYATRNKHKIILKKISGEIELLNNIKLNYESKQGIIHEDTKIIILNDNVIIGNNKGNKLFAKKLSINGNNYTIFSDGKIKLLYKNIELTATKFNYDKNKLIKFSGSVKIKIKGN